MGRANTTGIYRGQDDRWHVDKIFRGHRLPRRSFGTQGEAEDWVEEQVAARKAPAPGVVPTFDRAAAHYVKKHEAKTSIELDMYLLGLVVPFIGALRLDQVDDDALEPFKQAMQLPRVVAGKTKRPLKQKSINLALDRVRRILNLASRTWRAEGKYWLPTAPPIISMLAEDDARLPMQLAWREQREHLQKLPAHLARMALFDLNTGLRDEPLCNLRWAWEVQLPGGGSVFVVPKRYVKGRKQDRVVVCNSVAQSIVESARGQHPEFVFVYSAISKAGRPPVYRPIETMDNTAWQRWRGQHVPGLRVHDMRHTVGMRLREAGVPAATRDDILWHAREGMSDHYAVAQVLEIRSALELITTERHAGNVSLASLIREKSVPAEVPAPKTAAA